MKNRKRGDMRRSGLRKRDRDGNPRRYTFKIYPTREQADELLRQCSMVGSLWNAFLEIQEQQYRRVRGQRGVTHVADKKPHLSHFDLTGMVRPLREQCPEWAAMSTWTAHRVAYAVSKAFDAFFARAKSGAGAASGYPRYKSYMRGEHNWLPHRFASGCKLIHSNGNTWKLRIKGVDGEIHARGKLPSSPNAWTDADIRFYADTWWLSVAVDMSPRLQSSMTSETHVRLDGIDCFAEVNGRRMYGFEIGACEDSRIEPIQQRMAQIDRTSEEYLKLRQFKRRLQSHDARRRREKLHEWTTALVRGCSSIELTLPTKVKDATKSGKGTQRAWGAAVETKAILNRQVLAQAPAMAIQMIRYKCREAGICLTEKESKHLDVGNLLVEAKKASRKVRSSLREVLHS